MGKLAATAPRVSSCQPTRPMQCNEWATSSSSKPYQFLGISARPVSISVSHNYMTIKHNCRQQLQGEVIKEEGKKNQPTLPLNVRDL